MQRTVANALETRCELGIDTQIITRCGSKTAHGAMPGATDNGSVCIARSVPATAHSHIVRQTAINDGIVTRIGAITAHIKVAATRDNVSG